MALFLRALPFNDVLILLKGKDAGKATDELVKWSESIERQSAASPVAPEPAVRLGDPAAGAPLTATTSGVFGGSFPAGIYNIQAYREVLVEDPVSSSCDIDITFTNNGKSMTRTLPTFAGTPQQDTDSAGDVTMIEIDPNTTIGYAVTIASNTPGLAGFQVTMISSLLQTVG